MNLKQETAAVKVFKILENRTRTEYPCGERISGFHTSIEKQIRESIDYLNSKQAEKSMALDPYWPKWHSPWWHMTLLDELDLTERIPYRSLEMLENGLDNYLHFFPFTEEEVPAGRDMLADVLCLCALATAHRILLKRDYDVDKRLGWLREWYVKYQLNDGGYNCDEAAYTKEHGSSSIISTIHMVETMLDFKPNSLTETETQSLDRAADYIIKRRLMRSIRKNQIMDPQWTLLTFPRFYEIDILRALQCVLRWSLLRKKPIPWNAIEEVVLLINDKLIPATDQSIPIPVLTIEREFFSTCKTRLKLDDGTWLSKQPISEFPLLVAVGTAGQPAPILMRSWLDCLNNLEKLLSNDLLVFE